MRANGPAIHLVTDRRRLAPAARTVAEQLAALQGQLDDAIGAGVDVVQIRERDLDARPLVALVSWARARVSGTHTQVVVNDRLDVALVSSASGVHLRGDGPPTADVRTLMGPRTVGRSIHRITDLAGAWGADYVFFGTVFESGSKDAGHAVTGVEALRALTRQAPCPVIAIGGITPANAASVIAAGAAGIAAIGAFLPDGRARDARGPVRALAEFRAALATC